jgi:hypothetical protein
VGSILTRLENHPACSIVPEMDAADLAELEKDIREHGQRCPIYTFQGKVLDGRARLRVLRKLRIEPVIEKLDPQIDPYDFVLSINVHRRHLTKSQIASILAQSGDRTHAHLKAMGISNRLVQQAKKVHEIAAPSVIQAVDKGRMSLNLANRISSLPKDRQDAVVEQLDNGARPTQIEPVQKRPAVAAPVQVEPARPTPESIVEQFRNCPNRLETIKQLIAELAEHEQMIVSGFLKVQQPVAPAKPEPVIVANHGDRVSNEMLDSPKMAALALRLGGQSAAIGTVRLLLRAADRHAKRGDIGCISDAAIASECGWVGDPEVFVGILVTEGWLIRDEKHRLLIVDWETLALASDREAVMSDGGYAVATKVPKVKEKLPKRAKNEATPLYSQAFEAFWEAYPPTRKQAKKTAWSRWRTALLSVKPAEGETAEEFLVRRCKEFAASEVGQSKYCPAPAVWLNGGRYDDAPEAWTDGKVVKAPAADPEFDKFWAVVPESKRIKITEARAEWDYAVTAVEPQDGKTPQQWLIDRMVAYAKSYQGRSKYAATPADWLRDGRYFDEEKAWARQDDTALEKSSTPVVRRRMTPLPGMERKES